MKIIKTRFSSGFEPDKVTKPVWIKPVGLVTWAVKSLTQFINIELTLRMKPKPIPSSLRLVPAGNYQNPILLRHSQTSKGAGMLRTRH